MINALHAFNTFQYICEKYIHLELFYIFFNYIFKDIYFLLDSEFEIKLLVP